jgi:hypothetical protein
MNIELRCWYAAVDWASEKHDIVVTDCAGKRLGRLQVEHSGEGLARMAEWLITTAVRRLKSTLPSRYRMAPSSTH